MAYSTITVGIFSSMLFKETLSSVAIGALVAGTLLAITGDAAPNGTGPSVMLIILVMTVLIALGVFFDWFDTRLDFIPNLFGINFFRISTKYQIYAGCFALTLFSSRFLFNSLANSTHLLLVCGSKISSLTGQEARVIISASIAVEKIESLAAQKFKPVAKRQRIAPAPVRSGGSSSGATTHKALARAVALARTHELDTDKIWALVATGLAQATSGGRNPSGFSASSAGEVESSKSSQASSKQKQVRIILPTFAPIQINRYDTLAKAIGGESFNRFIFKLCKRSAYSAAQIITQNIALVVSSIQNFVFSRSNRALSWSKSVLPE